MTTGPTIVERLTRTRVLPLIQVDDASTAVQVGKALLAGGLDVLEVVLRTDGALACLEALRDAEPDAVIGAGTVLSLEHAEEAFASGARFIVSPGLDDAVVAAALAHNVPVFPGVATATEIQRAWNLGLRTVKFFPAEAAGGTSTIKALSAAFRGMRFIPTGGISADNLASYLSIPAVSACGGSWLTPAAALESGDLARITELASEAVQIARSVQSGQARGR